MSTFYNLPESGTVVLHTHLSISENAHQLFGFENLHERSLFRQLIKVSGVGPKMALAVLSSMDPNEVVAAIIDSNITALTRIPGVGKKTAERLVIEMRIGWQIGSCLRVPFRVRELLEVNRWPAICWRKQKVR